MEISPVLMAWLLLYSFFFGTVVGVFYDINRVIRVFLGIRYSKRAYKRMSQLHLPIVNKPVTLKERERVGVALKAVIFIGDTLSVLFGAVGIIVLNYSYNSGSFRFFGLVGAVLGFLAYYYTVGRLVMGILEPLVLGIKYLFLSFFIVFGYPFLKFSKFIAKTVKKIVFLYSFTLEKRREKLYNVREEVYLFEMAKNGFLNKGEQNKKER